MQHVSPAAETALLSVAQAVGARSIHITPVRVCDHCNDAEQEAFPYNATDRDGNQWADLCNACYDKLGCLDRLTTGYWDDYLEDMEATTHHPHIICAGCGQPITGDDLFNRVWEHTETCAGHSAPRRGRPHQRRRRGAYSRDVAIGYVAAKVE